MFNTKIAVIGCGYWGKNLVRNFSLLGALGAVCDANRGLEEKASKEYNVPSMSFEAILKDPSISGVVIAAPAIQHFSLAEVALKSGKHVFVEKPLALKITDARFLCNLAQKQNRILMVGHLLQYHPAFLKLKEILNKGELGKLQYIYSNRLNLGKIRNEESILWSFAPHDISMILGLVEELPESVYAIGSCHLNPHIQDVTTTHLSFKNGIEAHIFVSWLHPFKEQKLVVVGDKGMAVFDDGLPWGEKLQIYPHQVNWIDGLATPAKAEAICVPLEASEPLKLECQHFLDCIIHDQTPRTDGEEGFNVLRILDAAEHSLNSKAIVSI